MNTKNLPKWYFQFWSLKIFYPSFQWFYSDLKLLALDWKISFWKLIHNFCHVQSHRATENKFLNNFFGVTDLVPSWSLQKRSDWLTRSQRYRAPSTVKFEMRILPVNIPKFFQDWSISFLPDMRIWPKLERFQEV